MSAIAEFLAHVEASCESLVQEVEKEASVLTQWAAGDWAKFKELFHAAKQEASAAPVQEAAPQPVEATHGGDNAASEKSQ